jgi:hypothetical protein
MLSKTILLLGAAALCLSGTPAVAQTFMKQLERPDPATVSVPDIAFTPTKSDINHFDEYFYFHKPGVRYERAFADLNQCRTYGMVATVYGPPPVLAPLGGELDGQRIDPLGRKNPLTDKNGEYVGILPAIFITNYMEELARGTERRCMMWKGYARYGVSRTLWQQIETGSAAEKLARMAVLASGPAPTVQAIEP